VGFKDNECGQWNYFFNVRKNRMAKIVFILAQNIPTGGQKIIETFLLKFMDTWTFEENG
jgi:hypothetical protein